MNRVKRIIILVLHSMNRFGSRFGKTLYKRAPQSIIKENRSWFATTQANKELTSPKT